MALMASDSSALLVLSIPIVPFSCVFCKYGGGSHTAGVNPHVFDSIVAQRCPQSNSICKSSNFDVPVLLERGSGWAHHLVICDFISPPSVRKDDIRGDRVFGRSDELAQLVGVDINKSHVN